VTAQFWLGVATGVVLFAVPTTWYVIELHRVIWIAAKWCAERGLPLTEHPMIRDDVTRRTIVENAVRLGDGEAHRGGGDDGPPSPPAGPLNF
jgi:hypothetical protein